MPVSRTRFRSVSALFILAKDGRFKLKVTGEYQRQKSMKRRLILNLAAGVLFLPALTVSGQHNDLAKILGDWSGESICVGGNNPNCNDEQVVYHITPSKTDAKKLTLNADKIVNGKPEPMGELEMTYDPARQTLTCDLQNPRFHMLWEFTIKGKQMWGVLYLLPERTVGRNIRVTKIENNQGPTNMSNHASGTFEVKMTPQDDKPEDKTMGRMTIAKQWHGELEGTSTGQMLSGGDVTTGSAGYVAMEKFTGTLKARKGTFILQHSATMVKGEGQLTITIVPESGTGELTGIRGKLAIKIENGKHFYGLEYELK